jgi:hypothetical protein
VQHAIDASRIIHKVSQEQMQAFCFGRSDCIAALYTYNEPSSLMYCMRLGLAKQVFAHAMQGSHFRLLERMIREPVVSIGASFADSVLQVCEFGFRLSCQGRLVILFIKE